MLVLDHLAISATTLEEGAAFVQDRLGLALEPGGKHDLMGTHNRLLGLGDMYLEVIAVDPAAPDPGRPVWFDLDRFQGKPRLTNWITRCDDLHREIEASPPGVGRALELQRGAYHWQMAVPDDGILPYDNAFPALIRWLSAGHPARALPETGLRLRRLEVIHPEGETLAAVLRDRVTDPRVHVLTGPRALRAELGTPRGPVWLE